MKIIVVIKKALNNKGSSTPINMKKGIATARTVNFIGALFPLS
jgi:hypothetical protein